MNTSPLLLGSFHRPRSALIALGMLLGLVVECHALTTYSVSIDSTALSGQNGKLAFDLTGGDAAVANNTATVGSFVTDGTLGNSAGFALTDTDFFNEVLRDITFGTSLSFTLNLSENNTAPGFDQFSFFLLNTADFLPLFDTTDPLGAGALFAIDLNGTPGGNVGIFAAAAPGVSWQVRLLPSSNVPDSGNTLWLSAIALATLALVRARCRAAE